MDPKASISWMCILSALKQDMTQDSLSFFLEALFRKNGLSKPVRTGGGQQGIMFCVAPLSDGAAFLLAGAEAVLLLATSLLTDAGEDALCCLVLISRAKDVLLQTRAL